MPAMSWSGYNKRLCRRRASGNPLATMTSTAMVVAALLVAGCGRATLPIGASGLHATAAPTSVILPGTALPWTSRPQLVTTFDNTDKGIVAPQAADEVAIAPDGTIYAEMDPSMWPLGIPDGLYRLTPQASRWQLLGVPPDDAVEFSNIPGAGLLWCAQNEEDPGCAGLFPAAAM